MKNLLIISLLALSGVVHAGGSKNLIQTLARSLPRTLFAPHKIASSHSLSKNTGHFLMQQRSYSDDTKDHRDIAADLTKDFLDIRFIIDHNKYLDKLGAEYAWSEEHTQEPALVDELCHAYYRRVHKGDLGEFDRSKRLTFASDFARKLKKVSPETALRDETARKLRETVDSYFYDKNYPSLKAKLFEYKSAEDFCLRYHNKDLHSFDQDFIEEFESQFSSRFNTQLHRQKDLDRERFEHAMGYAKLIIP